MKIYARQPNISVDNLASNVFAWIGRPKTGPGEDSACRLYGKPTAHPPGTQCPAYQFRGRQLPVDNWQPPPPEPAAKPVPIAKGAGT